MTRHQVDDEEPPDSPFYNAGFQAALAQSKGLAQQLADALSSGRLHTDENSVISGLYRQATAASQYCGPKAWKIGFIGDSAAGNRNVNIIMRELAC